MIVGVGVLELHLPHARDLKSKRRVVKGLVDRLHARHRISAAETGFHELHQRAEIGVAMVARDGAEAERLLDEVLRIAESESEAWVTSWSPQVLEENA
jgi:uncharacterized protein YlxP (DUF503 family)